MSLSKTTHQGGTCARANVWVSAGVATLCCLWNATAAGAVWADVAAKVNAWHCRPDTLMYRELVNTDMISFDHQLVVAEEHQGRDGDVFVGMQRTGEQGKLWIFGNEEGSIGFSWVQYDGVNPPPTYLKSNVLVKLPALLSIVFSVTNAQFESLKSDATVLIGYGLRNSAEAAVMDSYREMLAAKRFLPIWGPGDSRGDMTAGYVGQVCMKVERMQTLTGPWDWEHGSETSGNRASPNEVRQQ